MPKQTKYLVFAGLLAAVPLTALPGFAARAAGECRSAPNHQSSEGGHWYYRLDRTSHRKCWHVGPAGRVRSLMRKPAPHRVRVAHRSLRPVAEAAAAWDAEQPDLPIRAAVVADDDAQGTDQATSQRIAQPGQNVIIAARWPDPVAANGSAFAPTRPADIAGDRAGSTVPQRSVPVKKPDQVSVRVASRAPEASPAIHSRRMLELLAGGLAIAGAVGCMMYEHSVRRRRDIAARAYAAYRSSSGEDSILPILARASKPAAAIAERRHVHGTTIARPQETERSCRRPATAVS